MSDSPIRLSSWKQPPEQLDFLEPDRWFVGEHCHRYPQGRPIAAADILHGWLPETQLINRNTRVLAFGSCFAEYFIKYLAQHGYNRWQLPSEKHGLCDESLLLSLGQTFENVFVIEQQLRWAFGEFTPESALWFTKDKSYFEATEERRENIRRSFQQADVLVVTFGVSEIWYDRLANEPLWRAVPARLYDPERHAFRRTTVAETVESLYQIDRLIEAFLPDKKLIFTLSPIPLISTFRDQSPVTANQVSKSILRASLDEFFSNQEIRRKNRYHYFPSYELVFHLFASPFLADNRHIRPEVAASILNLFSAAYTDLPNPPTAPEEDPVRVLEGRIRHLEQELARKEMVIRDLDGAAQERLALIQKMSTPRLDQAAASCGRDPSELPESRENQTSSVPAPAQTGMAFFYSAHYRIHNAARLHHLASLGLPLAGRVLEVGSGPGDHTGFYLERGCSVVATDARDECLRELQARYPQVEVRNVDMNHPEGLAELGAFDVVHCYGLLYHLESPERALDCLARVCTNLLLLETCVSPEVGYELRHVAELLGDYTQAIDGRACRPTRTWLFENLKKRFPFVYQTRTQPNHAEFPTDWTAIPADGGLVRVVMVASQRPYDLPTLSPTLLDHQDRLSSASRVELEARDAGLEELREQLREAHAASIELGRRLEETRQRCQIFETAATERLAIIEQTHQTAEQLRALRKSHFLRYLMRCLRSL